MPGGMYIVIESVSIINLAIFWIIAKISVHLCKIYTYGKQRYLYI